MLRSAATMRTRAADRPALLQGTLDLLILRTLLFGPLHGHGIATRIAHTSEDVLLVDHGSLYPALHRLEREGLLAHRWERRSNGRDTKLYRLTPKGRRRLTSEASRWKKIARAMSLVLDPI
jgi:PadR family transcriptional regulator, regulatory protein PadR